MPVSGVYRLEVAKTGAAVCQEVSCKAAQIKIDKGCPRIGVLVQLPNSQCRGPAPAVASGIYLTLPSSLRSYTVHSKTGDHAEIQSFKW